MSAMPMNHDTFDEALMVVLGIMHRHWIPRRERVIIKRGAVFVDPYYIAVMRECLVMMPGSSDDQAAAAERNEAAVEMVCQSDYRKKQEDL